VDSYMPSDQFASFVDKEQVRIESMLKEVGLIK
jgi:tripartite-type tricarboxylate transporter receptor subunit TctC